MTTERPLDATQRFWGRVRLRALLRYAVMGVLLVVVILFFGRELGHHISAIEAWIEGLGALGLVVFIVMFVVSRMARKAVEGAVA